MAGINLFDSKECTWKDIRVYFAGALVTKIRGLKYKTAMEKELLHAAGDKAISTQKGNRTNEGSIKVLKGAVDDMNRFAQANGGDDLLDMTFDIVIHYKAQGSRAIQIDTLVGVDVKEYEKGMEQGAKQMDIELPIVFLDLKST